MYDMDQTDGYGEDDGDYFGGDDAFDIGALPTTEHGTAVVATSDAGPSGQLRLHDLPDASSIMVGTAPHGATVRIVDNPAHVGSGAVPGWVQVEYDGDGTNPPASGFASATYLAPGGSSPSGPVGPSPSPSSGGMSTTAIVVGVAIAAAAIGAGYYLLKRRKRGRRK